MVSITPDEESFKQLQGPAKCSETIFGGAGRQECHAAARNVVKIADSTLCLRNGWTERHAQESVVVAV